MSKVYPELAIVKYRPSEFLYKPDLMEMEEKCFAPSIQGDWEEIRSLIEGSISCMFVIDRSRHGVDEICGKFVGSAYAIPMEKEEDIDKDDPHRSYWLKTIRKYQFKKVAYLYSISVHPDYSGKDLAKRMMIAIIADCKAQGYDVLLSHAKDGASLHLHDFFGGIHINSVRNWYDTGATHTLCSINLHNTVMIPIVPFQQDCGYDCGIACMETLLYHAGTPVSRDELIKISGVNKQGTTHEGMVKALVSFPVKVLYFMLGLELGIALRNGNPCILHVLSPGVWEGHYVVAMGLNEDSVYVFEPYDGLFGRMSFEELSRCWYNNTYKDSWGITIHKEWL
jgi:GNAT superfamily N-acetyltransferase